MNPNTKRIREVADAILHYHDFYDQGWYGVTFSDEEEGEEMKEAYEQAGIGVHNCDTTACIAGFTVQIFGDPKEYQAVTPSSPDTHIYAQRLLGLNDTWVDHLFTSWPLHWCDEDVEELKPLLLGNEGLISKPNAHQAHRILHRLADQFDNKTRKDNA